MYIQIYSRIKQDNAKTLTYLKVMMYLMAADLTMG